MTKDDLILMLAERLFICSRLLTCAAERLSWDSERVQALAVELEDAIRRELAEQELNP